MNVKTMSVATMATLLMSGAALSTVFADTNTQPAPQRGPGMERMNGNPMKPMLMGVITAVNGTSLTVTGKSGFQNATSTFTVDASNAKVVKKGATTTVSALTSGEKVMIEGTVTGTSVVATMIRTDVGPGMMMGHGDMMGKHNEASSTMAMIQGDGHPVIAGSIASITGNSMTLSTKTNLSYTVDLSSAKVLKMGAPSTITNLAVGDFVVVQGTVQGSAVVATTVMDQGVPKAASTTGSTNPKGPNGENHGFLGNIGNFFKHMFGF
ncbi:MAG: hypothetical protein JWO50_446 [Candidatus Kaiserbacteria bacterium]|nr:hypothetical protein [Candidatus Kaiserbacteria bacterium]